MQQNQKRVNLRGQQHSVKSIIYLSLTNTMKDLRKNIKLMASLGMKMSSPKKEIPGKVDYSLILTE